ncbi:MAG: VanZ family protein [Candidatus Zixiibacteriota bacterium]
MIKHFAKFHLPAVIYAILIIIISSVHGLGLPPVKNIALDKLIHFIEYALFAVLIFRSFSHLSPALRDRIVVFLTMLFITLFAVFDEIYQSYVPGRHSDPFDFLFDIMGALFIILYLVVRKKRAVEKSVGK